MTTDAEEVATIDPDDFPSRRDAMREARRIAEKASREYNCPFMED